MAGESKPDLIVGIDLGQTCTGNSDLVRLHSQWLLMFWQVSHTITSTMVVTSFDGYRNGQDVLSQTRTKSQPF